jgi:hypothetical protein
MLHPHYTIEFSDLSIRWSSFRDSVFTKWERVLCLRSCWDPDRIPRHPQCCQLPCRNRRGLVETDYRIMIRSPPPAAQADNRFEALSGRSEADGGLAGSMWVP